jgi:phosphotransferase system HPr (HPr) family protein
MRVVVPWPNGLHLRPAAKLVEVAQRFRSKISMECRGQIADTRSILSLLALCASMGTTLDIQASGDDELAAAAAVEEIFNSDSEPDGSGDTIGQPT